MICMIGTYMFEVKDTDSLRHEILFSWSERKRLGNHPLRQATGIWDESITIEGRLLASSVRALDSFEQMAKSKEPLRLTLGTGESFMVVAVSISKRKRDFLKEGKFITQEFSVSLKRWFE